MNVALEQLHANRATGDLCHKDLDLNAELAACLNKAQASKAIKQATTAIKWAEVCHTTTACTLQQAHRDSVLVLECQTKLEERQDCQAFMEAFRAAIQACLPENQGTFLYPLQLLASDVPLAALLGMSATAQLQAVVDGGLATAASIPSVSEMLVPQMGAKCWCHSLDQGVPTPRQEEEEMADINDLHEECPCHKWKEGRLAVKTLKEHYQEAFSKESEVVKLARQAYYKAHWPNFEQEGSYDLFSSFWQMVTSTNLLGTKIHEMQESWGGRKDLWATNWAAKSPQRYPFL